MVKYHWRGLFSLSSYVEWVSCSSFLLLKIILLIGNRYDCSLFFGLSVLLFFFPQTFTVTYFYYASDYLRKLNV